MTRTTITADGVNIRSGPGTSFKALGQVYTGASGEMLEKHASCDSSYPETWYRVRFNPEGREAWVYSRYARLDESPAAAPVGVTGSMAVNDSAPNVTWARWDPPVSGYTITNTHENERAHDGLDFSCSRGTIVRCGPFGGVAVKVFACQTCNPNGDGASSLNDRAKGYGYGSYVIVAYRYDLLPTAIRIHIPAGSWLFAMHAHLSRVSVVSGQQLSPWQEIGQVGATGNVYGNPPDHLHLALRVGSSPNQSWDSLAQNKLNPDLLYSV
jgi:uncharacterized protein YraI